MSSEGHDEPGGSPGVGNEEKDLIERRADEEPLRAEIVDRPLTINEILEGTQKVIDDVTTSARRLVDRGRYRKLRISRKGKQVLPDIPLAAVAAIEAASMYGAGVARVLAVNVGARFLFDVDVVNEADEYLVRGKQLLLDGDLDGARAALEKAIRIDDTHAEAHLQIGVLSRLRGEPEDARQYLLRAVELDETGDVGSRARAILDAMNGQGEG